MRELLTTSQVARALGVSEASLKRWCDKGLLPVIRTPGGHRRLPINGVVQFVRNQRHTVAHPDILGLPATVIRPPGPLHSVKEAMQAVLVDGDEQECQRLALGLYLDGNSAQQICDDVITAVFTDIGDRWAHGDLAVYEERRATEIALRILYQLRMLLDPVPEDAPLAIGGTLEGDLYTLPTTMIEIALREAGWRAQSYGSNHPVETLCAALRRVKPKLFWLSVSYIDTEQQFLSKFRELHLAARDANAALVVGGRALNEKLLPQMRYTQHGATLAELVSYARSLPNSFDAGGSAAHRSTA